jgi:hypothetical protein
VKLIREIKDRTGKLIFRRWQLLRTRWFSVYLHGMYEPEGDQDDHCHDHPWSFWGLVLWGGYREVVHDTTKHWFRERRAGSFARMQAAGTYHKILSLYGPRSYSLVIASRKTRLWGYWTQDGFIDFYTYRKRKHDGSLPSHEPTYMTSLRAKKRAMNMLNSFRNTEFRY